MDSAGLDAEQLSSAANVVPIGTRGRPGRGSNRRTPSAAARSLAPATAAKKTVRPPAKKTTAKKAAPTKTPLKKTAPKKAAPSRKAPSTRAPKPEPTTPVEVQAPVETPVEETFVLDPGAVDPSIEGGTTTTAPRTGIPLSEWIGALTASATSVLGDDWESKTAALLGGLRRRVTGDYPVDELGLDPQIHAILLGALRPLANKWFRIEVRGAENVPAEGGALIVSNHSGTVPVDAAITGLVVHDHAGRDLRMLGADLVFSLPFVGELARKTGATLACAEDAERLLAGGHVAGVWPEGFKGIGKPYSERYKLQRFGRGGFVSSAMRAGVPIVPVSIVGAEEIYPLVGNVPSLARLIGVPYIPITPFFPLLGPLGLVPLPSKWIIEFGEPIRTDAYSADAADDPMLVFNVTDQVRETIQQTLYSLLLDRGHPFV